MTRQNRASQYNGANPLPITPEAIKKILREDAGQQIPPGAVPENRVAPSVVEDDVIVTRDGKTTWISSADLPGVIEVGADLAAHLVDNVDAHDASAISTVPAGSLSATDVQGSLTELDTEKVAKAGDTMTGTLNINSGVPALGKSAYATNSLALFGVSTDPQFRVGITATAGLLLGDGASVYDWTLNREEANAATLGAGDSLRSQQDSSHANDLVRKSELIQVRQMAEDIGDELEIHHHDERYQGPNCSMYQNASQSIAENTVTYLVGHTKAFQSVAGMVDTANNQIVIPRTGLYRCTVQASFVPPGVNIHQILSILFINGAQTSLAGRSAFASATTNVGVPATRIYPLAAGDLLKPACYWYAAVGGTYATQHGQYYTFIEVEWVGPIPTA